MNLKILSEHIEQSNPPQEPLKLTIPLAEIFPEMGSEESLVFREPGIAEHAWAMKDAEAIRGRYYPEATTELVQTIALIAVCHQEPSDTGMSRAEFYVNLAKHHKTAFMRLVGLLATILQGVSDESVREKKDG